MTVGSPKSQKARFDHLSEIKDQVPVGTKDILESPHVSEGPGRIANSPVPSIFNDDRGEIHRVRVGHRRMNLLFSKKGVMRSGYLHPHVMKDFVVSGSVELWTLGQNATNKTIHKAGEYFTLDPYVPHILHFLEDTISLEFWDGPFSCWYYHPYRRVVALQNSLVEDGSANHGLFQHLVPQDTPEKLGMEPSLFWWTAGLFMGAAVGFVVGARRR